MGIKNSRTRKNLRRSMALQRLRREMKDLKGTEVTRKEKKNRTQYVGEQIEILEKRVT